MIKKLKRLLVCKPSSGKNVLVLVDWDNFFMSLFDRFRNELQLESKIKRLMDWIEKEIGPIVEGYGFVFAPEHLNAIQQDICVRSRLKIFTCPKIHVPDQETQDTVDETLMWFGRLMIDNPNIGFICLVSGDDDYVPFLEGAKKRGIKIALAPPTIDSLSKSKRLIRLADNHPKTGKRMLLVLETLE